MAGAVFIVEKDKVPKTMGAKLSIRTIASDVKIWYHMRIQVDYAYSTK